MRIRDKMYAADNRYAGLLEDYRDNNDLQIGLKGVVIDL